MMIDISCLHLFYVVHRKVDHQFLLWLREEVQGGLRTMDWLSDDGYVL